jgi:hypothetical protein
MLMMERPTDVSAAIAQVVREARAGAARTPDADIESAA